MPRKAPFDIEAAAQEIRAAKKQKRRDDLDFLLHEYLEQENPTLSSDNVDKIKPELTAIKAAMKNNRKMIDGYKETLTRLQRADKTTLSLDEKTGIDTVILMLGDTIRIYVEENRNRSEEGRIIIENILSNKETFDLLDQMAPLENNPVIINQVTAELKKCNRYALPKAKQKLEALLERINTEFEKCINQRERKLLETISIVIAAILTLPVFAALTAVSHYKTGSPAFWKGKDKITPTTREGKNAPFKPNKSQ